VIRTYRVATVCVVLALFLVLPVAASGAAAFRVDPIPVGDFGAMSPREARIPADPFVSVCAGGPSSARDFDLVQAGRAWLSPLGARVSLVLLGASAPRRGWEPARGGGRRLPQTPVVARTTREVSVPTGVEGWTFWEEGMEDLLDDRFACRWTDERGVEAVTARVPEHDERSLGGLDDRGAARDDDRWRRER